ncbi:MAG: hypothetical protein HND53_10575 [Proteobacteria bacterium]|nr:hypothetical protein [Pseudomonadota bacterium]
MSNNPIGSFMKISELYFKFTESKSASSDIDKVDPFIFSIGSTANEQKKSTNNKVTA